MHFFKKSIPCYDSLLSYYKDVVNNMTLKKGYLVLFILCAPLVTHASDNQSNQSNQSYDYLISLSAGPGWTNAGTSQTIALEPDVINAYIPDNLSNPHVMTNAELFLGIQKSYCNCVHGQFGLAFYASSNANLDGYIQVDGDPNFQNYAYNYKIRHEHLALKTKWFIDNAFNMNPYVSASLGVGLNHSYSFSINPLISQEIPPPPFKSHTQTALSYSIGVGFERTLNCHYSIALGYELVSWGRSSLNRADGQTSSHGLRLNNLYTQGLVFNVSYIA